MKVDMHLHTSKSDGRDSLHSIVEAAEARGLDLIAITDHGPGHGSGITWQQARDTKKRGGAAPAWLQGLKFLPVSRQRYCLRARCSLKAGRGWTSS